MLPGAGRSGERGVLNGKGFLFCQMKRVRRSAAQRQVTQAARQATHRSGRAAGDNGPRSSPPSETLGPIQGPEKAGRGHLAPRPRQPRLAGARLQLSLGVGHPPPQQTGSLEHRPGLRVTCSPPLPLLPAPRSPWVAWPEGLGVNPRRAVVWVWGAPGALLGCAGVRGRKAGPHWEGDPASARCGGWGCARGTCPPSPCQSPAAPRVPP